MNQSKSLRGDILFTAGVAIAIYVAYVAMNVFLLVYVSALFAVVLAPAIEFVRRLRIGKWRPGRGLAILTILLSGLASGVLFLVFVLPPVYHDAKALAETWPSRFAGIMEKIRNVPFLGNFDAVKLQEYATSLLGGAIGLFRNIAGSVFGIFSWLIITAYFILDGERAFHWGLSMFPRVKRERLERTMLRAQDRMRHWLVGQGALMLILGLTSLVVFGALKLKYFYALAVFAGLANIIPIIGPIVSFSLVGVVALFDSPVKFFGVAVFYVVYQQIETAFLTPKIMKSTVDLPPLAVIIALSLGGTLAGVLGALIAVPTAALCAVVIDEYLVQPDTRADAAGS